MSFFDHTGLFSVYGKLAWWPEESADQTLTLSEPISEDEILPAFPNRVSIEASVSGVAPAGEDGARRSVAA